jgi:hypothetical protein
MGYFLWLRFRFAHHCCFYSFACSQPQILCVSIKENGQLVVDIKNLKIDEDRPEGRSNLALQITIKGGKMKRKKILSTMFVFMFLMVSFWLIAEESKNSPVAVSPGSDTEVVSVRQSCPTFSWSAVDQASSYRIAIFEVIDPEVSAYEEMAAMASPVLSKTERWGQAN